MLYPSESSVDLRRSRTRASAAMTAVALLATLFAGTPRNAAAAAPVAPTTLPASAVKMSEDARTVTLDNGIVTLVFDKAKASLTSLVFNHKQLLAGGGYLQIAFTSRRDHPQITWECRTLRSTPELVELAFVNVNPASVFDFETHYIFRANEAGFHNYLVWGHDPAKHPGVAKLAQYNFAMRVDPGLFRTAAVDDQRIMPLPDPKILTPDRTVMDSTYRLPDGTYFSKYFLAAERDEKHPVHGAMSEDTGIWVIMPSHEHLNGGPEHQELTVHPDSSIVLLGHAQGAHYGAGILSTDDVDGAWRKVSAPWFIYVNTGRSQTDLWRDAKQHAAEAVAAWPYRWLDEAQFQINRGSVAGRLIFDSAKPVSGARVILANHEETPSPLLWQQQWRGYRFYGWAGDDGRFQLSGVRPGTYDLYVWQPGSFGYFLKQQVKVQAGEAVNLQTLVWKQPAGRETLWQIGTPDHSAAEFGLGDTFRQWGLWKNIADSHPNGVTFVVGKSHDRDWPFEMGVTQKADHAWQLPVWRVQFENASARSGKAILRLGVAAYEGKIKPQLSVSVNGKPVGAVTDLLISGAAHRSGIHAGHQEREISFDAALLKVGNNELVVEMPSPGNPSDRVENLAHAALLWDCLRLEIQK